MPDSNIWNITVDSRVDTNTGSYPAIGGSFDSTDLSTHFCGSWCNHSNSTYYWTGTYPTTIYMYQIRCPVCEKMNWAQLETTIDCKTSKCKTKLRAVSSKPDHIVEVEV